MKTRLAAPAIALAAASFLLLPGAAPEDEPPLTEVRAGRAAGAIRVDGKLDEEAWARAARVRLRRADGTADAARATAVRIAYDERHLYLAFECEDPDIWTAHRGRDSHMWTEDVVEAFIDIDPADPGYVELEVNPHGDLFDGIFLRHRRDVLMGWNPAIAVAVAAEGTVERRGDADRSWTVEMAVPVGDLAPAPGVGRPGAEVKPGTAWRVNFYRNERSGDAGELLAWAPVRGDFHETARFGRLVFE